MPVFRRVLFRSEEHTSELQSHSHLVCRLLLEKKNTGACGLAAFSSRPALPWRRIPAARAPGRSYFFFLRIGRPPRSTLFPSTTLFRSKRDHLCAALEQAGLKVLVPQGTYFANVRSEEHTSELQSHSHLVCRLLLET